MLNHSVMNIRYLFKNLIMILVLLVCSPAYTQGDWVQVGLDIDGEATNDRSGGAVSISSDGVYVAIGAELNDGAGVDAGHVRVYENVAGTWVQLGGDINGEAAGDLFGSSVSISDDGTTVAVGATNNDGSGTNAGHARVYQLIAGVWTQIGADIDGEFADDLFGSSVSLNADGTIVAIGAELNNGAGIDAGHVRVYEFIAGTWTQIGADIDGELAYDWSGASVALNDVGDIVVIGARRNDGTGGSAGHARVFQNIAGVWTQVGGDIDGEAIGDQSGHSVSINGSGTIVAVGAPKNDGNGLEAGHVRVYENIAGVWTQIGADLDGVVAGDEIGWSVSLNTAGDRVAMGAPKNDDTGAEAGHVLVFQNTAGVWTQLGTNVGGEALYDRSGWAVSMSGDGNYFADGAYVNDGIGTSAGHVRVYELQCDSLDTSLIVTTEYCLGDPITLDASSINGGTITWDGGVVNGVPFTPGAPGVYTYNASSDHIDDCTFSIDITVNDLPVVTASVDDPDICLGESATFTGGGADSYSWDMGVTDGVPFTPVASGTVTYTVTGTDATTSCQNTATVDLTVYDLPVVTATVDDPDICLGESATFTGGGADTYTWDMGVTDGVPFTPGSSGTVTYTVTGTNTTTGCQNTATVDLTVYDLPVVTATVTPDEICLGESVTFTGGGADTYAWDLGVTDGVPFTPPAAGVITHTVTGTNTTTGCQNTTTVDLTVYGLPTVTATALPDEICLGESVTFLGGGADTYTWDSGVTDGVPYTPVAAGVFTFTVTGTNTTTTCENTATVDVTVHDLPPVTALVTPLEICLGESATFTGGGADTYTWDMGVTDGVPFTPGSAGTVTYTVTGTNTTTGCENTATIDLTVHDLPAVTATATPDEICLGEFVTFTGAGADAYTWDMGVVDGVPFSPAASGTVTYTVTGLDITTSCENTATVDVTVYDIPTVTATATPDEICLGESITFTGGGADAYTWDMGVTDGVPFTPVSTGVITFTVTGTVGATSCSNTATVDVTVHDLPAVTATVDPTEICLGESAVFTGGGADAYVWDSGVTDGVPYTPGAAGILTYTVTGTNALTGCENTATVDLTVHENPVVTATAIPNEVCLGESITFTGGGADTYVWDGGIVDGVPFTHDIPGVYTYTVTGTVTATGCSGTASVSVTVHDLPEITAEVSDSVICFGESVIFTASGGVTYEWDGGMENGEEFTPDLTGVLFYTVTGTSSFGCENTATVQLIVHALPNLTADLDTVINTGGIANLYTVTDIPGSFVWEPDYNLECSTCDATEASPAENTTYTVYFTDDNGCTSSDTVLVWVNFVEGIGVADIFSPNGDGNNDVLFVQGYNLQEVHFEVFNKYGEKVFVSSEQSIGWDGTFRNRDENPGVFTWILYYNLTDGRTGHLQGNTTLIR